MERRRRVGWQLYELAGVARGDREAALHQRGRNYIFFGAPVGFVFTIDRDLEQGSWLDYGMFLQTLMVAARASGLDTCPQAAIANYPAIVREIFSIPDSETVVCGMVLGWADPAEPANALVSEREPVSKCCATIKVRTPDDQGEKVFCGLRRREGEARPEAQAAEHLA